MEDKEDSKNFKIGEREGFMKLFDFIFSKRINRQPTELGVRNYDISHSSGNPKNVINIRLHPKFTSITQEEIDDIHARGKITQAEKVKEWESLDICAPGDNMGSASWRCRKYHYDCHDCLVAYSSVSKEFYSSQENFKLIHFQLPNQEVGSQLQESNSCKKRSLTKKS